MDKLPHTQTARKRRVLLEETLMVLMQRKGYAQTTVTDLCREAGIPRRTFYHYFDSKEDVLYAVIENMLSECSLEVMLEFNSGYDALMESLIRNFQYWMGPARWKMDLMLDNGLSGDMTRCALHWLETHHRSVLRRPGMTSKETEIAAMVGISGFFTLLIYWRKNDYRETPEEMADYASWILAKPLFTPLK